MPAPTIEVWDKNSNPAKAAEFERAQRHLVIQIDEVRFRNDMGAWSLRPVRHDG